MFVCMFVEASLLLAALASGQATQPVSSPNASAPMVDLGYVKYQGWTNATAGISYFRGIQYEFITPHSKSYRTDTFVQICGKPNRRSPMAETHAD